VTFFYKLGQVALHSERRAHIGSAFFLNRFQTHEEVWMATLEGELKKRVGMKIVVIFSKDHSRAGVVKEVFDDYIHLEVSGYQETDTFFIRLSAIDMFYESKT